MDTRDIFTQGGCGILAQEILSVLGWAGTPVLWFRADGTCSHAAVLAGGRLLHLGDRETGYREATVEELNDAVRYDFTPRIPADECRALARALAAEMVAELG